MSILGKISELQSIKAELKLLSQKSSTYRKRKVLLEKEITDFLLKNDQVGVKYKNVAIICKEKAIRKSKKKIEQQLSSLAILKQYGISNPERVLEELQDAKKEEPKIKHKIELKYIKQN